jgi:8-oxo-dGTP pyrophosphatase MutT (NUDIX family)
LIDAALREVKEETGYSDLLFIKEITRTRSCFFAAHKDVNRIAHATGLLFELRSTAHEEVDSEEKKKHEAVWIPFHEVSSYINIPNQHFLWDKIKEDYLKV